MSTTQAILHVLEGGGKGGVFIRLIPFVIILFVFFLIYNFSVYRGLGDAQSMDNAQLARQIVRGEGFTTRFIRPAALGQLGTRPAANSATPGTAVELFPQNRFPADSPRILPDTYNAPGYPYLLAGWFRLLHTHFEQAPESIASSHMYGGDRPIPWLNQVFLLFTAVLVFALGRQLFDYRVAWMGLAGFLVSDLVWQYSITALSTSFLMFLMTAAMAIAVKIFSVGEANEADEGEGKSEFWPAWCWALLLGVVLGLACLTRLHLLVFLLPLAVFLFVVPRSNILLVLLVTAVVALMVAPWFWHMNAVSGSPVGSNARLLQLGEGELSGGQIYRTLENPGDPRLMKDMGGKESAGFSWHFEHAWQLLGCNPLVLLFVASLLHTFRRRRTQALRWLVVGSAFCLVAANNLCMDAPLPIDEWNILVLLLPAMLPVGSAFFFILLDRLDLEHAIFSKVIAVVLVVITAFPLTLTLWRMGNYGFYNYPPYLPPYLRYINRFAHPDHWITTDMPWATAWYGDHPSLWLPDTVSDFNKIYDDDCPSDMLLLTPVTLGKPASELITGEEKEWFPFISGTPIPADFPLNGRVPMATSGPQYIIWAPARPH